MDEMEMEFDIISIFDDEGNRHDFEIADRMEYEDKDYIALVPVYDEEDELMQEPGEIVVLEVLDVGGNESYIHIADREIFDKVSTMFMDNLEEIYDFVDDTDD